MRSLLGHRLRLPSLLVLLWLPFLPLDWGFSRGSTLTSRPRVAMSSSSVGFERKELLRNLGEIESVDGSWFRLTALGKQRFATLVLNLVEASARDYSKVDLRGRWKLRLNNQEVFRFWLKGMEVFLHFKGGVDDPNNFEKTITLPTPIRSIRLLGNYTVVGGSNADDPVVSYWYDRAVVSLLGKDVEVLWSGSEDLGSAYVDSGLWIGGNSLEYSVRAHF